VHPLAGVPRPEVDRPPTTPRARVLSSTGRRPVARTVRRRTAPRRAPFGTRCTARGPCGPDHAPLGISSAGGPGGIRTHDQGIMSPLLSPLSYGPEPEPSRGASSGGETRTLNRTVNSRVLCQLSYPGRRPPVYAPDLGRAPTGRRLFASINHPKGVRVSTKSSRLVRSTVAGRASAHTTRPPKSKPAITSPG